MLHVLGRSLRFVSVPLPSMDSFSRANSISHPIPSQFPFAAEIEFGREGDKTEEKLSRKKGGERERRVRMDEGGNVWRPFPLVPPPSSQPSLRFVCRPTHGGLITRAADLKLSVPLGQPTNRPPLGAPNDPNLTLARSLARSADKLLHFFHSFSPLKLEDGCPRRGDAAPGSSSRRICKKSQIEEGYAAWGVEYLNE